LLHRFTLVSQEENNYTSNADITALRRCEFIRSAAPHHAVYLPDASNSMKEGRKPDALKEAMKTRAKIAAPVDKISIITFTDSAETIMRFMPCAEKINILQGWHILLYPQK